MKKKFIIFVENKRIKNFSFLTLAQFSNYLLPLLIFPYLIRIIGIEEFGRIMYVLATLQYLKVVTEYGFTLVAAKDIAQNKHNIKLLSCISSSVIASKIILLIISSSILFLVIYFFGSNSNNIVLYYFAIGIIIGEVLFPVWFFQGIEDMKYIAILQFLSKLIFIILILIFINSKEDYVYVLLCQGIGQIIGAIVALCILKIKYKIIFFSPSLIMMIGYFKDGFSLFISGFFVKIYMVTNTIILGWIENYTIVGYYTVAEKIVLALSSLVGGPLNQTIYPHLAEMNGDLNGLHNKVIRFSKILTTLGSLAGIFLFLFSTNIVYLVAGEYNMKIDLLLKIMALSIPLFPFGAFFTQILVILKRNILIMKITMFTIIFNFILIFPLIYLYGAVGIAINIVLVRIAHTLMQIYYYRKNFKLLMKIENL